MNIKYGFIFTASVLALAANAGEIKWGSSYNESLATAKSAKKIVMIDFYTDWCGWCKKLDADTYPNDKVVSVADTNFVSVKINAEKGEGIELAKKYKVSGYPTIVFVDGDGTLVGKQVGYQGPDDFVGTLNKVQKSAQEFGALQYKVEQNPKDATSQIHLAEAYATREDGANAIAALSAAEKADKGNKELGAAYNAVGDYFQNSGKYAEAITYFEKGSKAAKDGKTRSYSHLSLAACYAAQGKFADAMKQNDMVIKQKDAPKADVDMAKTTNENLKKAQEKSGK